jgi:hypothetical protein
VDESLYLRLKRFRNDRKFFEHRIIKMIRAVKVRKQDTQTVICLLVYVLLLPIFQIWAKKRIDTQLDEEISKHEKKFEKY